MICPNCGNQNADGQAFCQYCGAQLGAAQMQYQQQFAAPKPSKPSVDVKAMWGKYKKFVFIGVGVLAAVLILIILLNSMPTGVSVKDCLEVKVTGYNGYSELEWKFDDDAFFDAATDGKYTAKLKGKSNGSSSSSLSDMMKELNKSSEAYLEYQKAYSAIGEALKIEVKYPDDKS